FDLIDRLDREPAGAIKIRLHGNYRLECVLVVKDDVAIVDFEGNPRVPLGQRRAKASPLRDVASMLKSFVLAVAAAKQELARLLPDPEHAAAGLREELIEFSQIFLNSYWEAARGSPVWIADEGTRRHLLVLYLLDELFRGIESDEESQPPWIDVAIDSINIILDRMAAS